VENGEAKLMLGFGSLIWPISRERFTSSLCDADRLFFRIKFSYGFFMKVKRIVTNIPAKRVSAAKRFYGDVLGLEVLMDMGWIATFGSDSKSMVQISFASEGGSGTEVPAISIEVDDVDEAYRRMKKARFKILYPLTAEPWGVRRFYVRDPFGKVVNILSHV
jgi:predicted enzyme related to lactoylglutathione lyase